MTSPWQSGVRQVRGLLDERSEPGVAVVGIDGPSGAGKTDFASHLATVLGDAPVVHMDDLYPGWSGLDAAPALLEEWVLTPLGQGSDATFRRWDWGADVRGQEVVVPASPVVIVEGVGAGARVCRPHLSVLVYLDAAPAVRRARALARDGDLFAPHWEAWASQEARHFAAEGTRRQADLVICS